MNDDNCLGMCTLHSSHLKFVFLVLEKAVGKQNSLLGVLEMANIHNKIKSSLNCLQLARLEPSTEKPLRVNMMAALSHSLPRMGPSMNNIKKKQS